MSCENIPSIADLEKTKLHADDFDRLMGTGTGTSTNGVTGQVRPTYNAVMANLGYTRVGTFASGATLLNGRQTLLWDVADGGDGQEYGWSGSFLPSGKVVPPSSTPLTTGGIAVGAWMSRFDPALRVQTREALRRSYAEAGYQLVSGSFESGATLTSAASVALHETSGKAYSGAGPFPQIIAAGTDPSSPGFTSRHLETLRSQVALNSKVITFKIPTDFPDLPSALSECAKYHGSGNKITVLIESGHALTKGYRFDNADLSFVSIKSVDAVVPCSPSFIPVSTTDLDAGLGRSYANMFVSVGGAAPEWGIKVSAAGLDMPIGYLICQAASGKVLPGCGVTNVTFSAGDGIGIAVRTAARLDGYQAAATGCDVGIAVSKGSMATIAESNTDGCGYTGVDVSRGSVVYMNDSSVGGDNCTYGLYVRRSWVAAQGCKYSGSQTRNINTLLGSRVIAADSTVTAGSSIVAYVEQGSEIDVSNVAKVGVPLTVNDVYPKFINVRTRQGVISSETHPAGTATATNATTPLMSVTAASATINTLTYLEVLNLTGARALRSGTVYGRDVGVRVTVDGTVVLNDITRALGKDSLGDEISVVSLPYCASQSTLVVEVYNRASASAQIGWKLYSGPSY